MIGFKNIEFAYKMVIGSSYPNSVDLTNQQNILDAANHFRNMIDAMLIANSVLKKVKAWKLQKFTIPFSFIAFASTIKVAELALQINYGNVSLKGVARINQLESRDNPLFRSVEITWKSTKPVSDLDRIDDLNCQLFSAVIAMDVHYIHELLSKGADVNAIGPFNRTPVYAVMHDVDIYRILGEKGACRAVKDIFGYAPLQLVEAFGFNTPAAISMREHVKFNVSPKDTPKLTG